MLHREKYARIVLKASRRRPAKLPAGHVQESQNRILQVRKKIVVAPLERPFLNLAVKARRMWHELQ